MTISSLSSTTPSPLPAHAKPAGGAPSGAPAPVTSDQATISPAGHAALRKEQAQAPPPAVTATALSQKALQLGKQLKASKPVDFTKADTNGDGKLSASEARSAGLMP